MSLQAVLFRGVRFTPGKVKRKPTTCWNCRGKLPRGAEAFEGRSDKIRYLHPACAEAIAADGNEHIRSSEGIHGPAD